LKSQFNALTGLRGFAALWVAAYHGFHALLPALKLPGTADNFLFSGWLAVDLFFVLSGFVISHAHLRDFETFSRPAAMRFLQLRLARVYPAHLVAALLWLPLVAVAMRAGYELPAYTPRTFLHAISLTNGWGLPGADGWNLPSWSVGSEWFAYLTFPVLAVLLLRVRTARSYALVASSTLGVTYVLAWLFRGGTQYMLPDWGMLIRVESEFLIGCCTYGIYRMGAARSYFWIVGALGVSALACSGLHGLVDGLYIPLFAAIVLGLAVSRRNVLSSVVAVWLGKVSYSLYLVHAAVIVVLKQLYAHTDLDERFPLFALLAYILAIVCAGYALYATVEEPARIAIRRLVDSDVRTRPLRTSPGSS
jgi:peptidoglycan/LPS O-acetylase OafA/YrhL